MNNIKINVLSTLFVCFYSIVCFAQPTFTKEQLAKCNTAKNVKYLNEKEKELIQLINLVRQYPKQFSKIYLENEAAETVVGWRNIIPDWDINYYVSTLKKRLQTMEPMDLMYPNDTLHQIAKCWAIESSTNHKTGHERINCSYGYMAECCAYGPSLPIDILLCLLIDHKVPSLGHRFIILKGYYTNIGPAIYCDNPKEPFYRNYTSVLDFY